MVSRHKSNGKMALYLVKIHCGIFRCLSLRTFGLQMEGQDDLPA